MNRVPDSWRRMPPLPTTKDLLRIYKIKAKRTLSQNFILDPRILQKFVKTGGEFLSDCIEHVKKILGYSVKLITTVFAFSVNSVAEETGNTKVTKVYC